MNLTDAQRWSLVLRVMAAMGLGALPGYARELDRWVIDQWMVAAALTVWALHTLKLVAARPLRQAARAGGRIR